MSEVPQPGDHRRGKSFLLMVLVLLCTPALVQSHPGSGYSNRLTFHQPGKWQDPVSGGRSRLVFISERRLQQAGQGLIVDDDGSHGARRRDIHLAIILGSFSAFIAVVVGGPLCCICYGAKRIRDMRTKAAATHSLMFAEQWRAYNLFMPFNDEEELGQHTLSWSSWQFVYRGIPDELNGLSTAIFQSIPPVSGILRSGPGQALQQIRLNPGCARLRRSQSLQCLLPLSPSVHPPSCLPNVNYFEMTILSFCRTGTNGRSSGSISGRIAIGLAARPAPPFRLPGHDMVSLGFHSNGSVFINDPHDGLPVSRRWNQVGTTVGCGYDLDRGMVFFTLNGGQQISTGFSYRPDGPLPSTTPHLFPVVGADCDITVAVNLGQTEFMFPAANSRRCIRFGDDQINSDEEEHQQQQQQQQQQRVIEIEMQALQNQELERKKLLSQPESSSEGGVDDLEDSEVYFSAGEDSFHSVMNG